MQVRLRGGIVVVELADETGGYDVGKGGWPLIILHQMESCDIEFVPYNPGTLPTKPGIAAGDIVEFEVEGYPPCKDTHFSIRNVKHKDHDRFIRLRDAGIKEMKGRAWTTGPIRMTFILYAPSFEKGKVLLDYAAGIEDTLDGSSGFTFTYLPVVFEDDCQICELSMRLVCCQEVKYHLTFEVIESPE